MIASAPSFLALPPERPGELARRLPYSPHLVSFMSFNLLCSHCVDCKIN